ncbi:TIGR00288 family NYN domain-containing protein [Methanobacterium sp. SMA-27]|uniref:TIGR00288 family NYN domain-containing protein n=1 Tax=Methanobacterium sp. SMA-27 TaxID=1495336 RepID=UPI00064E6553|nr:TIGR00288 family NYN domain-containing protein [Methanobacterium sp. SMA-27]
MRRLDKFSSFKEYIPLIKHDSHDKNIGLLVDGPNMLRKEFDCDLDTVKDLIAEYGNIKIGKVFLNQYASDKLIEAVVNQGFSPMIVAGETDVQMAVEAFELIHNPNIDIIAIMTRDVDFFPLINVAKEHGKKTIVIGAEPGFSVALKNSADIIITLKTHQTSKTAT